MAAATDGALGDNVAPLTSVPVLRNVLLVYLLLALAALAYWPASEALYEDWTDFRNLGSTHGFLVLAISLWLIFRSRHLLIGTVEGRSAVALIALLLVSFAWLILWRAGLQDPHLMLIPAILWLGVLSAFGRKVAVALALPIGFLYFALPGWAHLASVLQALTTRAVGLLASAFGLRVYIEGNTVGIPEGTFDIEGGCSGIHFLVVGLALAVLLGELIDAPIRRRVKLVVVMAALAIACNWIRVFTIVMAGHLTNMQHFLIREHYTFGWALFAVVVGTFIWITARPEPHAAPIRAESSVTFHGPQTIAYVAAAAVMLIAPILGQVLAVADARGPAAMKMEFPTGRASWSGPAPLLTSDWQPKSVGADIVDQVTYFSSAGTSIKVAAIIYRLQEQGAELIGEGTSLLGDTKPVAISDEIVGTPVGQFRELIGEDRERRRFLIRYRYDIGGRQFVQPMKSQLWYGIRSLGGAPYSAVLAYGTACNGSCDDARRLIDIFLEQMAGEMETSLPRDH